MSKTSESQVSDLAHLDLGFVSDSEFRASDLHEVPPLTLDFDLLLLDLHMPELDGLQVVQAIRQRERTAGGHLPVVALTARSRQEDRERCLAAGMDEFLSKPIQAADLWAAIDRVAARGQESGTRSQESGVRDQGSGIRGQESSVVARSPDRATLWQGQETLPQRGGTQPNSSLTSDSCPLTPDLDPRALLAACGDDAVILDKICQAFRSGLPAELKAVQEAWQGRDAARLREAAHKVSGMIAVFSTVAGSVASNLEDQAAQGRLDEARPLVEQLETMARELIRQVDGLSLETLRQQAAGPRHDA